MWPAVIVASASCYVMKLVGISLPKRFLDNMRVMHVAELLPVALLAALIATQTFTTKHALHLDARVAGLAAAVVAIRYKAPFLVIVVLACTVTALVRLAA
jgi:branched-subunit amino acid transport protein